MEKNYSDYIIKLSGGVSIPVPIDDTKSYKILLDGAFPSSTDHNNEDGTYTKEFKFKPIMGEIIGENGEITKIKDVRKASQKLRAIIRKEWETADSNLTEEEFYQREMNEIISERLNNR
jgi:hypothetical protein